MHDDDRAKVPHIFYASIFDRIVKQQSVQMRSEECQHVPRHAQ